MAAETSGFSAVAVLRLCAETRESMGLLVMDQTALDGLQAHLTTAEAAVRRDPIDYIKAIAAVRLMRYILVQVGEGSVAPDLADSAARVLGDDVGRLFS